MYTSVAIKMSMSMSKAPLTLCLFMAPIVYGNKSRENPCGNLHFYIFWQGSACTLSVPTVLKCSKQGWA